MSELQELIVEGEGIRKDIETSLETRAKVKTAWNTVTHWYTEALAYVKLHSSRPTTGLDEWLDASEEMTDHYQKVDRLLARLRGVAGAKSQDSQ